MSTDARGSTTDAGGRDLRVLLLAPYPIGTAPGQRFRIEQYLEPLRREGIRIDVHPLLDRKTAAILYQPGRVASKAGFVLRGALRRARDAMLAARYDVVMVFREAYPLGYPAIERLVAARGIPYLFDFDDAIYLPNASAANSFATLLKFPQKTSKVVKHAALTVAGNQHLAEWARAHTDRVTVIPTTIDTDVYRPEPRRDGHRGRVCVGWSGSKTTTVHLELLSDVLRVVQREYGVRLRVIGDESFRIPGAEIEAVPWREETELEDLREIDIGVMPLPDDEWARGKCGLKALQYMALGIPAVMSPVGVNREIAAGGAAMLAESVDDWRRVLATLIEDGGARQRVGAAGRERVHARFSVHANAGKWVDAFRLAAGRR